MRYLSFYTPDPKTAAPMSPQHQAEMGKFVDEMRKSGVLVATGAFLPGSLGARLRREHGKITVLDGDGAEPTAPSAGFALLEARSRAEVVDAVRRFLEVAGDGETEVFALMDGAPER